MTTSSQSPDFLDGKPDNMYLIEGILYLFFAFESSTTNQELNLSAGVYVQR